MILALYAGRERINGAVRVLFKLRLRDASYFSFLLSFLLFLHKSGGAKPTQPLPLCGACYALLSITTPATGLVLPIICLEILYSETHGVLSLASDTVLNGPLYHCSTSTHFFCLISAGCRDRYSSYCSRHKNDCNRKSSSSYAFVTSRCRATCNKCRWGKWTKRKIGFLQDNKMRNYNVSQTKASHF